MKPELNQIDLQLGALIRECRRKAGLSQRDLASKLGYTQPVFVSLFENGGSRVPLQTLGELVVLLNIPEKKITKILLDSYALRIKEEIAQGKKKRV